jgi:sterol desaturase/sphingolipid hydroxylase (fatty acid hydroxylase superfamily)
MTRAIQFAVRYGYVAFMILGLNAAAYFVVAGEHSYAWLAPLLAMAFVAAHFAERVAPWFEEWNEDHHDNATNIWHVIIYESQNINGLLYIPLIAWLTPWEPIWPTEWPLLAQLLLAIVLADFALMFLHFLSHRFDVLWRLHAVHHGVSRLYGFNGIVRHPLHQAVDMVVGTAPLVAAGMPVDVAILLGFAISVQLIVQHSNVAYALGPLENQLSIGRIHHLHHVNWGKEGDCNFGLFLTIWDRMLGTFNPEPPRPITAKDMGIDEVPNFPKSYLEQLVFPLNYTPGTVYEAPSDSEDETSKESSQTLLPAE